MMASHSEISSLSGISVENSLSIALQNKKEKTDLFFLPLLAVSGILGSIFSFLTMFHPTYTAPQLIAALVIETAAALFVTLTPNRWRIAKLLLFLCTLFIAVVYRDAIKNGFIYLLNDIYGCVNETDMAFFQVNTAFAKQKCCTVFLVFASAIIVLLICIAVVRFHNLFLSLLATFPFVEIGFYFGFPPDYFWGALLLAFWFGMTAVHMAEFGSCKSSSNSGFIRRKNTFFPVSSMRFMVTGQIGVLVCIVSFVITIAAWTACNALHYQRSDRVKRMRSDIVYYFENYSLASALSSALYDLLDYYGNGTHNPSFVRLGKEGERRHSDAPVAEIALSEIPESRVYLKCYTGSVYYRNQWLMLPETAYDAPVFDDFSQLDFFPQDFLYQTIGTDFPITLKILNGDVVENCIPYGMLRNSGTECAGDYSLTNYPGVYQISDTINYEQYFSWIDGEQMQLSDVLEFVPDFSREVLTNSAQRITGSVSGVVTAPANPYNMTVAALDMTGYSRFVRENYLTVPDTTDMRNLKAQYEELLSEYPSLGATPCETIRFLESLREEICSSVTYSLSPGKTPGGQDFVNYFLNDSRKGYCVHYATAGAVLARMAGIPTRYCEGYLLDCSQNGVLTTQETDSALPYTVQILDKNAHAWTEVYIEGAGWIPFEFTYSYFDTPPVSYEIPGIPQAATEIVSMETETVLVSTEENNQNEAAPETKLEDASAETTNMILPDIAKPDSRPSGFFFGLFAAVVAGCGLLLELAIFWRYRILQIRKKHFQMKDTRKAAFYVDNYLYHLMHFCGVHTNIGSIEKLAEDAEAKCQKYLKKHNIAEIIQISAKLRYSHQQITQEELRCLKLTAAELSREVYKNLPLPKKFWMQWVLHLI